MLDRRIAQRLPTLGVGPVRIATALGSAAVLVALLAGCGAKPPSEPSPSASGVSESAPAPSSAAASPSDAGCPDGGYLITGLTGKGSAAQLGSGTGGSLTMSFRSGRFEVGSNGSTPMKLDVGPGSAELRLDGTISGSYSGPPSSLRIQTDDATGSATIKGFGIDRQLSTRTIADQLLPGEVSGTATCTDAGATLDLPNVTLELTRS